MISDIENELFAILCYNVSFRRKKCESFFLFTIKYVRLRQKCQLSLTFSKLFSNCIHSLLIRAVSIWANLKKAFLSFFFLFNIIWTDLKFNNIEMIRSRYLTNKKFISHFRFNDYSAMTVLTFLSTLSTF